MDKRNIIKFDKFKSLNINKWIEELSNFSKREAKETNIASRIFIKMILSFFDKSIDKPNDIEIKFLQSHSKDLIKILAFMVTRPTPIPYILIAIILKRFKINLLPSKDDLKIPDEFKHIK
jgi:hypothetical protein